MQPTDPKLPPGPWRVEKDARGIRIYAANGDLLIGSYWALFSSRARTLDDIRSAAGILPPQEAAVARAAIATQEAVFDTIAALPDLINALTHAVRWHDQLQPADITRMRAALNKAEGRTVPALAAE